MVDMLVGGPGKGGHVGGKMNAGVEKPPDKFFRYSEADLVVGRLDMYRTKVLLYRTMVLLARPTKVRR
jgi:hypothetical protein